MKKCEHCKGSPLAPRATCQIMSRILINKTTGEPITARMDKETTRNMCREGGEDCPILDLLENPEPMTENGLLVPTFAQA
ncbi:MAG: hypothetical protein LIP10_02845 [Clostridiales bacterium]|nr:hypothetical protein [Clostridiales bacterium]